MADALRRLPENLDYYHAAEHLHEAAQAACPSDPHAADQLADVLVTLLWEGKSDRLLQQLTELSTQAGVPLQTDPPNHPQKVLAGNAGYFTKHKSHIDYPSYRAKGWPIGSGITESGVKRFGKRVKGSEQFWTVDGVQAILALQSKWLSEDEESKYYWLGRSTQASAA